MRSAEEARAYVSKLRSVLRYVGSCDGDMEKGNLRADVNVSVRRPGEPLGTRCEIKNVNSIRFIGQAIEVEARRQIAVIEDGGAIDQETRLFDPARGETRSMRSKEEAHDYRYFPDPDLLPLELDQAWIDALAAALPELPDAKKARFIADYGLSAYDATILVAERETADFFEAAVKHDGEGARRQGGRQLADGRPLGLGKRPESAGLRGRADERRARRPGRSDRRRRHLRQDRQGRADHAARPRQGRRSARSWSKTRGLRQVTDTGAIERAVEAVIAANPDKAEQAKSKPGMLGWFVGQVMKTTGGKANPQAVSDALKARLGL